MMVSAFRNKKFDSDIVRISFASGGGISMCFYPIKTWKERGAGYKHSSWGYQAFWCPWFSLTIIN